MIHEKNMILLILIKIVKGTEIYKEHLKFKHKTIDLISKLNF